jgi:hypothetical protein
MIFDQIKTLLQSMESSLLGGSRSRDGGAGREGEAEEEDRRKHAAAPA